MWYNKHTTVQSTCQAVPNASKPSPGSLPDEHTAPDLPVLFSYGSTRSCGAEPTDKFASAHDREAQKARPSRTAIAAAAAASWPLPGHCLAAPGHLTACGSASTAAAIEQKSAISELHHATEASTNS